MSSRPSDSDLPEYSIRVSDRARRVRLTVSAREGLVVVVPRGMKVDTRSLVAEKASWAHRSLERVAEKRSLHAAGPEGLLPRSVHLRAIGRELPATYLASAGTSVARVRDGALKVSGPDAASQLDALSRWLDRTARAILPRRLSELSELHGLTYRRVRITSAKSRWGSCSSASTISLNRMLLFVPPELVDALILHELAHTGVMDHSPRFWAYLATLDPEARSHRAQLKAAGAFVPAWAES